MHIHLVTDSFVSIVEQNYSPIMTTHKKASAHKEHSCFGHIGLNFSANNEKLAVNFLTCTKPAQKKTSFQPVSAVDAYVGVLPE